MNKILEEGLEKLGIEYSKEKIEKIEEFYLIFSEWNDKINLSSSSIQDSKDEFISRHILDSAGLLSYFPLGKMIGDLGSGGGFPGIVLKILNPLLKIELIEVIEKKITYLEDAIQRLGLSIPVRNPSKAKIGKKFDIMTCRAFGNLEKILTESKKYLKKPGKIIAYKGKKETILNEVKPHFKNMIKIIPLEIPFIEGERHAVIFDL